MTNVLLRRGSGGVLLLIHSCCVSSEPISYARLILSHRTSIHGSMESLYSTPSRHSIDPVVHWMYYYYHIIVYRAITDSVCIHLQKGHSWEWILCICPRFDLFPIHYCLAATNSKSPQGVDDTRAEVVVVSGFYCISNRRECANKISTQSGWEGLSRRKQERPQVAPDSFFHSFVHYPCCGIVCRHNWISEEFKIEWDERKVCLFICRKHMCYSPCIVRGNYYYYYAQMKLFSFMFVNFPMIDFKLNHTALPAGSASGQILVGDRDGMRMEN